MKEAFINKLVCQPWSIGRARGRALIASLVQRLRAERPAEDVGGDPLPKMAIVGDVAVIPIHGSLLLNLPDWVKRYGLSLTDIDDVEEEIALALADARVALIVLDFDSPGGWSLAGQKLFDVVAQATAKPVFAWCGDGADLGSAAYHGALPARMILSGRYALAVGCIGSYTTILDDTEFWKMMGITIDVVRSGELKGMGVDGFSEEQLAWLQRVTDEYGARFRRDVARYRSALAPEEMEGQHYDGEKAAHRHFTHGLATDLAAAIGKFRASL